MVCWVLHKCARSGPRASIRLLLCRHSPLPIPPRRNYVGYRAWHRLHRAQAIRMKLGGSPSLAEPSPDRPKGMHKRYAFTSAFKKLDPLPQLKATAKG